MNTRDLKNTTDKIRTHKKYNPPQPKNKDLPPCFNIILSCAVKNGGKTYNIVQLLTNYENSGFIDSEGNDVKMRTIWISGGTSRSKQNSILDTLQSLHDNDRIDLEEDVDENLRVIYDDIKAERDHINEFNKYIKTYNKFIKSKNLNNLNYEELKLLHNNNFTEPKFMQNAPKDFDGNILYTPRVVFLIFDDMLSTDGYGSNKKNFINRLAIKSRHESNELVGLNLIFITQSFKQVPAVVRRQADLFVLLKSANRNYIIDAIADEISGHFTKQEIEEYYDNIMSIPWGSLILSVHKNEDEKNRVRLGWTQSIIRDKKYLE